MTIRRKQDPEADGNEEEGILSNGTTHEDNQGIFPLHVK